MYILSKYKDYYDFYSGIYGIDKKIILDRREGFVPYITNMEESVTLYINGFRYDGYSPKGTTDVFFGEELKQFKDNHTKFRWWNNHNEEWISLNRNRYYFKPQPSDRNKKEDCPILIGGYQKFPQLSILNFHKVKDPFTMWRETSDWLSMRITEKENIELNISDADKARNKGMNPKTAFRPKMKN